MPHSAELISLTAEKMREHLLRGDVSAEELCDAHLERIAETNPHFNSFLTVSADQARKQATAASAELKSKKENSHPLTGIPVAIKDMLITEGIETTCASKILKGFIPPYDCTAVAKLKRAGAVILGKTNLDEFAMGSSNENSAYGPVRNPWDPERIPGGSSGGSVAAVALGQAPLALGTDTGGSIRQPAALSGMIGMKPTYGRVSRYGAVAFASSLDQIGPFARSVDDLSVILETISGHDALDATSMKVPLPPFAKDLRAAPESLKGVRVGVPKQYFIDGMEQEIEEKTRTAIKTFESLGAEIVEISLPHTEHALAVYYIIAPAEASSNLARYDGVRYGPRIEGENLAEMYAKTRGQGFGPEPKRRILIGTYVLSKGYFDQYYLKAQAIRTLIINDFKAAFNNSCDIIAAPVAPRCAWKLGDRSASPLQMYLEDVFTIPASLAGLPGLTVPVGLNSLGLPIGIQLLGPPFEEGRLLHAGKRFLEAQPFDTAAMTMRKV